MWFFIFSNFEFMKNRDYKHVKVFWDLRNVILDWVWLTNCQYYFPKEAQATRDSNEWLNGMNTQHTYTHKRKHTHTFHTHTLTHTTTHTLHTQTHQHLHLTPIHRHTYTYTPIPWLTHTLVDKKVNWKWKFSNFFDTN